MTSQNKDDYCLECHWEAWHLDGSEENSSEDKQQEDLVCPGDEHHSLSKCDGDEEEACCDVDDCSITCPSVCDGLVECDEGTACSVTHCDENNCDEDHCDENNCDEDHCENNDPVCFQDHCFDEDQNTADHGLESFLGLTNPLNLESNDLLSSTALGNNQLEQSLKNSENAMVPSQRPTDPSSFFPLFTSTAPTHCHTHVHDHFNCHNHGHLMHSAYPVQNEVNPADVFHMLGMCTDFSTCHIPEQQHCQPNHQLNEDTSSTQLPFSCFHNDHHHLHTDNHHNLANNNNNNDIAAATSTASHHHHQIKSPARIGNRAPVKGPCRTHHRCRVHGHPHVHPYFPYSRQSRSSISSHLISSPGETPPPLDGGASSVITSPEFSPVDRDLHVCKWTTIHPGIKNPCGATFADAGALQKHLISSHMSTVNGVKGNGYYCCWEGCHRPNEPFSQKSKLQGHFLTHSNYKNFRCSVCGKIFARQATLDRHERSHRGEKPYKCADCGKMFTDSSELKTHSRTHTGEKPFTCTYPGCNFQTGDSSNMSSHRLTHGERRHKCHFPGCTKSFTRPDQLKRHLKSTHKDDSSILSTSPGTDQFALSYGIAL